MLKINPLLNIDGYKSSHRLMYPKNTTLVYSNYTCRSTKRMPENSKDIVVFGIQYMCKYINDLWNENFFKQPKDQMINEAKEFLQSYLGMEYDVSHFEALHDLGYLPIEIKALEEGTIIKEGIPLFTIKNTHPDFFWVTNFLETSLSTLIWKPVHSASLSYAYKKVLTKYAKETNTDTLEFVNFQGHDFSFRGMQSIESAISSGMGFLTSFMGTDTIPALQGIKYYYGDDNVGFSVPASEHSVMCAHGKEGEIDTLKYLMKQYPKGILSVVSDTWNLWKLITEYLPQLKEEILTRDGKLVIRPDSGNPVDIICGDAWRVQGFTEGVLNKVGENGIVLNYTDNKYYKVKLNDNYEVIGEETTDVTSVNKGVIELLWDIFGGTVNEQGYKVLDSHIGAIYGDSITLDTAKEICERLKAKGFASTNVVLGIGSYSMGYATRDNQGGAVKSTYVEIKKSCDCEKNDCKKDNCPQYITAAREIFKDPITDDGTKKSAKGLIAVYKNDVGDYYLVDQVSWKEVENCELQTVYLNGKLVKETTFSEIRSKINNK
jgi:nicotinamide phosphoribosyltransferase